MSALSIVVGVIFLAVGALALLTITVAAFAAFLIGLDEEGPS